MPKICPLFSGSKANATYIKSNSCSLLVDVGATFKSLCAEFLSHTIQLDDIDALLITHEHSDHIGGLKTFIKNKKVPIIASQDTIKALIIKDVVPKDYDFIIADKSEIIFKDIEIKRFSTMHDCLGSSGYTFFFESGEKTAVCTDTGLLNDDMIRNLIGCNSLILESNHDIAMLKNGPYPPQLKMRILSEKGHLSNGACATALQTLVKNGTTRIILGHLSQKNNTPFIALNTVKNALLEIGAKADSDYIISAAKPSSNGVMTF